MKAKPEVLGPRFKVSNRQIITRYKTNARSLVMSRFYGDVSFFFPVLGGGGGVGHIFRLPLQMSKPPWCVWRVGVFLLPVLECTTVIYHFVAYESRGKTHPVGGKKGSHGLRNVKHLTIQS